MISMKRVVRALVRWSWVLILCVLVGWLGGKKLATLFPPQYQATALIQLNMQSSTSAIVQPIAAYASLVTSDSVLGATIKNDPDLDRQTMSTKQLIITNDPKSQTVSIQVALPNAREAASVANGLAHLLVAQQNAYIQQQYTNELKLLDGRIADEQKNIAMLNQQIIQLSANPPPPQNASVISQDQNQISHYQNLLNQDIATKQTLTTQKALDSSPLSVEQVATPPSKPSSIIGMMPLAQLILGVMFILGAIAIYLLEKRRTASKAH
jgi:capsular polysaccharide biosynthesis protein